MNLITRTIPALIVGLSGLILSSTSQADSSFSVTLSNGYGVPHASLAYHDSYRPYARVYQPRHRPPAHYVEKRSHKDYGYRQHRRYYRGYDNRYSGDRHGYKKYRNRDGHHSRKHSDRKNRRHHTGYARTGHY